MFDDAGAKRYALLDDDDIREWIADHEPDGLVKLQQTLRLGRFGGGVRAKNVALYLERLANQAAAAAEAEDREIARRSASATEDAAESARRSAVAAEDSAKTARSAYRVSWLALLVAIAAAIFTAWPLIKDVGRPAVQAPVKVDGARGSGNG